MRENELKLEISSSDAMQLLERNPFDCSPIIYHQRSIYFDSPEWDLFRRGVSLRIRQSGNERIQTIKASDGAAAGSFMREEWEQSVASDTPVVEDPRFRDLLGGVALRLTPMFEVHVKRYCWNVAYDDATIEVALDFGEVVAAGREAPLCEIEFEKKTGADASLFTLARRVNLDTPLHLGVMSKAERGYRLLGCATCAEKAGEIPLTSDVSATMAFVRIAAACLKQFRLNEIALNWSRNADALHEARVALRRLRSLCSISKNMFEDMRFDHLREELKWLASKLADARNIDVMIEQVSSEALLRRLQEIRGDAYEAAEASLSSERARALMMDMVEWISIRDWRIVQSDQTRHQQSSRNFASGVLDRLWRKVVKGGRDLIDADDKTRHKVRIAAKKLRYAAEFFGPLYQAKAKRHRRFIMAMSALQDELGHLNDLATAPAMLVRFGLSNVEGAKNLFGDVDKAKLEHRAGKAYDNLVNVKRFWR